MHSLTCLQIGPHWFIASTCVHCDEYCSSTLPPFCSTIYKKTQKNSQKPSLHGSHRRYKNRTQGMARDQLTGRHLLWCTCDQPKEVLHIEARQKSLPSWGSTSRKACQQCPTRLLTPLVFVSSGACALEHSMFRNTLAQIIVPKDLPNLLLIIISLQFEQLVMYAFCPFLLLVVPI